MKITSVKITTTDSGGLKAYASVCFNEKLIVNGVRVFEKDDNLNVVMPAKRSQEGNRYHDYAYSIDQDLRDNIRDEVLSAYNKAIENQGQ